MLPGSRTLTLREEAQMLLGYTSHQRWEYLDQVERCPRRGWEVAQQLRAELAALKPAPQPVKAKPRRQRRAPPKAVECAGGNSSPGS